MSPAPLRTIVHANPAALAQAAAERVAALSRSEPEPVTIALSGGSTPKRLYEALAGAPLREHAAWERVELFFGDERAVPPGDPESNYGMADRALLSKVPSRAHRMAAERGEAAEYEATVRARVTKRRGALPRFDLVLLGLGEDGHTASLFPGTPALAERERLVVMNEVPQKNTARMTFTYPLINAAARVWILVAGADKRDILGRCLAARRRGERPYPVLGVEPDDGELVWWLDRDAAADLDLE